MWLTKDIHHLKLNFFPSIVYCLRASQMFYKSCKLLDENFNCIALLLYYKLYYNIILYY